MNLRLLFDCKHEEGIARGIVELLDEHKPGQYEHKFYKAVERGDFLRVSGPASGKTLTVIYGGPSKDVINVLIKEGIINVAPSTVNMSNGQGRGYPLARSLW